MNLKKAVFELSWAFDEVMNPPKPLNVPEGTQVYDDDGRLGMIIEITDSDVFNNYLKWLHEELDYLYVYVVRIDSDAVYFRLDQV